VTDPGRGRRKKSASRATDERLTRLERLGLIRRGTGGLPEWLGKRRPPKLRGSVLRDLLEERERGGRGLDIKLTLSRNAKIRAPDIAAEARWLKKEGELFYPLHAKPAFASTPCWVYFIHDGRLVARACGFVANVSKPLYNYSGEPVRATRWRMRCVPPMQLSSRPISHPGFQGFRYIRPQEHGIFEGAFRGQQRRISRRRP
jgi:hypothetical protein